MKRKLNCDLRAFLLKTKQQDKVVNVNKAKREKN